MVTDVLRRSEGGCRRENRFESGEIREAKVVVEVFMLDGWAPEFWIWMTVGATKEIWLVG